MKRTLESVLRGSRLATAMMLVASFCCALASAVPLYAQNPIGRDQHVVPALALSRVFVSEAGWDGIADQHLVMSVFRRRIDVAAPPSVKSKTFPQQIVWISKQYSTRTYRPEEVVSVGKTDDRNPRQRWVNSLRLDCAQPNAWPPPPHDVWISYKKRCDWVVSRAKLFLHHDFSSKCSPAVVDHWGNEDDDDRARRSGFKRLDFYCEENGTIYRPKNRAWCDPRLSVCP